MSVSPGILEDSADVLLNVNMVEVELAVKDMELKNPEVGIQPLCRGECGRPGECECVW